MAKTDNPNYKTVLVSDLIPYVATVERIAKYK